MLKRRPFLICLIAAFSLLLFACSDDAGSTGSQVSFSSADGDNDGAVTLEEWSAAGGDATTFSAADDNDDGTIDVDEFNESGAASDLGTDDSAGSAASSAGSGSGGFGSNEEPWIEVAHGTAALNDGDSIAIQAVNLEPGEEGTVAVVRIINTGNAPLQVSEVSVAANPAGSFDLQPQMDEALAGLNGAVVEVMPQDASEGLRNYYINVVLIQPEDGVTPTGTLTIRSNSKLNQSENMTFVLSAEGASPEIQVTPTSVEFGNVTEGSDETQSITILNTGDGLLNVTGFVLTGHESFSFMRGADEWPISPEGVVFDEPLEIAPGTVSNVAMRFKPEGAEAAEATLILYSNDEKAKSGTVIPVSGNLTGPCISVNPPKINFGGKKVGNVGKVMVEVLSCGESPLVLESIQIVDVEEGVSSSTDFALNLGSLWGLEDLIPALTQDDVPVEVGVNEKVTFEVTYTPDALADFDENTGQPIPDLGMIEIISNTFVGESKIQLEGFGTDKECPTAVIIVQEGEEVIPQTKLHLIGSQSYAAEGSIAEYEWSVQQPVGSQSVFLPSKTAPDPTFLANTAGTYVFTLKVWDQNGEESCVDAEYTVFVNPDEAIHVELLWHTPNDPDETDEGPEAGADLDLHFLHPFASGEDVDQDGMPDGWFDQPFDCFWFNAHPNWGSLDPMVDDDPGLDLDDTDGAGPENVNLNIPQDGMQYKVGVHYWNDHGFGPSLATVRIYIYSSLVFQLSDVEMINLDLWEVADIAWPSGIVTLQTDAGGNYKLIPNYQHPFFPTPD